MLQQGEQLQRLLQPKIHPILQKYQVLFMKQSLLIFLLGSPYTPIIVNRTSGVMEQTQQHNTDSSLTIEYGQSVNVRRDNHNNDIGLFDQLKEDLVRYDELEVKELIGAGSFATVHVGRWKHCKVALKIFKAGLEVSDAERNKFLKECSLLRKCSHPNVVTLYGLSTDRFLCIGSDCVV
jgi:hypothetical protein